jgi:biopolymer transport protein ExbB
MRIGCLVALGAALLVGVGAPVLAQEAKSLDELLRLVEEGRASEKRVNEEREAEFRRARDRQQALLAEAVAERTALEKTSAAHEDRYDANEILIADVADQLDRRMGNLRELFGVLQQVASDTEGVLESSVTSAQLPGRGEFLLGLSAKVGSSSSLASIEEIERLWYVIQQEMTETGKVVRFPATVITTDGQEEEKPVVRVGAFNVVSDGRYLQYSPETGRLSELRRQPQGRFLGTTSDLFDAKGESVVFGVDPTRGQILETYVEKPNLRERIDQGGLVGYIIIGLGVLGLLIALERFIVLSVSSAKVSAQLKSGEPVPDNPLGRVLQVAAKHDRADVETLELKLGEAVYKETPKLTRSLLFLKIISVVAPLLGLLGTVTGMIVTFQAITLFGTGDPKLMAGGISQALVTTVLGLTVAIPMVLLHTLVNGRSRRILHILQEQSAGIVAGRSESKLA